MSARPVLVVGATGNVGPHLVKHLLGNGRPERALAATRARPPTCLAQTSRSSRDVPAFQESAASRDLPAHVIETITEAARLAPDGAFVASDDVIRRILGRPASGLRDWVERHRDALTAWRRP